MWKVYFVLNITLNNHVGFYNHLEYQMFSRNKMNLTNLFILFPGFLSTMEIYKVKLHLFLTRRNNSPMVAQVLSVSS